VRVIEHQEGDRERERDIYIYRAREKIDTELGRD